MHSMRRHNISFRLLTEGMCNSYLLGKGKWRSLGTSTPQGRAHARSRWLTQNGLHGFCVLLVLFFVRFLFGLVSDVGEGEGERREHKVGQVASIWEEVG